MIETSAPALPFVRRAGRNVEVGVDASRLLLVAGWASAILITAMDIYGLPDSLKAAWQVIVGG